MKGFTLLETMVVLLICVALGMMILFTFATGNQTSITQERLVYMNSSLRTASGSMTNAVSAAGFGMLSAADYAFRPFNNVGNVLPDAGGFDPAGNNLFLASGGPFTVPALAGSDALITVHADQDCERLTFDIAASTWIAPPTYTLVACLPQPRCNLTTQDSFGTQWPIPTLLPNFDNRVLLVVDEGSANQAAHRALRIQAGSATTAAGPAGGCAGNLLQMTAIAGGLQISNTPLGAPPITPIGRLVTSNFFYLGDNLRLYQFPLTYFSGAGEAQDDRAVAESVDSLQLRYYAYNDLSFALPLEGCLAGVSCGAGVNGLKDGAADVDGVPQIEDIRMVDVVLLTRAEKPDNFQYVNLGARQPLFDDPTAPGAPDNYHRRIVRQQILAKNLDFFNYQINTYP